MEFLTQKQLEDKYESLKSLIIDHIEHAFIKEESTHHLNNLKDDFFKDINSVRQLDAVDSISDLIRLLEKRLLLGWFKVDPFSKILDKYGMDGNSIEKYFDYLECLGTYKLRNGKAFSTDPYDADILVEVPPNSEVIPRPIAEHICEGMKDNWLEFGKELVSEGLVLEGQLDELIASNMTTEEKTQQLLDFFVKGDKRTKRSQLSKLLRLINETLWEEVNEKFIDLYKNN